MNELFISPKYKVNHIPLSENYVVVDAAPEIRYFRQLLQSVFGDEVRVALEEQRVFDSLIEALRYQSTAIVELNFTVYVLFKNDWMYELDEPQLNELLDRTYALGESLFNQSCGHRLYCDEELDYVFHDTAGDNLVLIRATGRPDNIHIRPPQ